MKRTLSERLERAVGPKVASRLLEMKADAMRAIEDQIDLDIISRAVAPTGQKDSFRMYFQDENI